MSAAAFLAGAYLLGAVPAGYVLFRLTERRDIRGLGSRNTGATNVLRLKGWRLAVPVLLFDLGKGFLPAWLGRELFGDERVAAAGALLAVLGHCFPVYIGFRGGKGVATSLGAFAGLAWAPLLVSAGVFVIAAAATRYASLGSLLAVLAFPVAVLALGGPVSAAVVGGLIFLVVAFRHAGNIARLAAGTERKLGQRA